MVIIMTTIMSIITTMRMERSAAVDIITTTIMNAAAVVITITTMNAAVAVITTMITNAAVAVITTMITNAAVVVAVVAAMIMQKVTVSGSWWQARCCFLRHC